jgi:23S rRNA (guanosine2251-2'-O)-methyltransferase
MAVPCQTILLYGFASPPAPEGNGRASTKQRKPGEMKARAKAATGLRHKRGAAPAPRRREDGLVRLFGLHAVEAALKNPARRVLRLLATENALRRLGEAVRLKKIAPEPASPRDLDRLLGAETVHQGVLLEAEPLPEPSIDDLARAARPGAPLVVLDHVTDPHNAGAVLRSAAVFGAAGLLMTRRHSPPLDGALAKAASGALDLVPVLLVQNLARTLLDLKAKGVLVLGLDDGAEARLEDESFAGKTAIVLGAEGKGLRELTGETCDRLVRITTAGPIKSLNVSNAAAVALHVAATRRHAVSMGDGQ